MRDVVLSDGDGGFSRSFTVEQRRALYWRWMTGGENRLEAAEFAGVSDRSIYNWLNRPDFKAAWDDAESWHKREVRTQRATLEYKSIMALHTILDSDVAPGVKVDAASKALTDVRQTRALDTQPARAGLSAYLEELGRESAEILKEARRELGG